MRLIFLLILPLLTQLLLVKQTCSFLTESNLFIPSTHYTQKVNSKGLNLNNERSCVLPFLKFGAITTVNSNYHPDIKLITKPIITQFPTIQFAVPQQNRYINQKEY